MDINRKIGSEPTISMLFLHKIILEANFDKLKKQILKDSKHTNNLNSESEIKNIIQIKGVDIKFK